MGCTVCGCAEGVFAPYYVGQEAEPRHACEREVCRATARWQMRGDLPPRTHAEIIKEYGRAVDNELGWVGQLAAVLEVTDDVIREVMAGLRPALPEARTAVPTPIETSRYTLEVVVPEVTRTIRIERQARGGLVEPRTKEPAHFRAS
jgi:hypothetical protein